MRLFLPVQLDLGSPQSKHRAGRDCTLSKERNFPQRQLVIEQRQVHYDASCAARRGFVRQVQPLR